MITFDLEFWTLDTKDVFDKYYSELVDMGISEAYAKNMLEKLYHAVSHEYGD